MHGQLKHDLKNVAEILGETQKIATDFMQGLEDCPPGLGDPQFPMTELPENGIGSAATLKAIKTDIVPIMSGSAGPRYFGFVTGGNTPASLAGDWLAATFDQNSMLTGETGAPYIEHATVEMLRDLLGYSDDFTGCFLTGATMASFTSLAVARQVELAKYNWDAAKQGLMGAPVIKVLSGAAHSSALKCMSMLGLGTDHHVAVQTIEGREAVDLDALEEALKARKGHPTIVVANAGTVNSTDFDDLTAIAKLKDKYDFWLHVDAAFGAYAICSPKHAHLVEGINAADSITVDCHKWLNVPYDSAVAFTRHLKSQIDVFQNASPYLGQPTVRPDNYIHMTPENSRRLRALAAWASLMAYGRDGYRDIIERNCDVAHRFGELAKADDNFNLYAPVKLNVTAFQALKNGEPLSYDETKVLLKKVQDEGTAFFSPSIMNGQAIIRAAVSNWRTTMADCEKAFEALTRLHKS